MKLFLGRYTPVIVTTFIFVTLVVSVLGTNFYLSFQTEANAEVVNIAGRQRMLSQRIAKSLSNVRARYISGQNYASQLEELEAATNLFNTTVLAFKEGGPTISTKQGETQLSPVTGSNGITAVDQALVLWLPLSDLIQSVVGSIQAQGSASPVIDQSTIDKLNKVQSYLDNNINTLLKLMNDLTNHTETVANSAADRSRLIQTVGILASLICFAIILYLIFGQLRVADEQALAAKEETERIFETVTQGLFLIDRNGEMSQQQSKALTSIFGNKLGTGRRFQSFIEPLIATDDWDKIQRYIELLFDPHKKQRLLIALNPLNKLAIQVEEQGQMVSKYLSFAFTRVVKDDEIISILTSVADITNEVMLERELAEETTRNEQQLEMVKLLLGADSRLLPAFLETSDFTYAKINEVLKDPARTSIDFKDKARRIFILIHRIKGESAALGLSLVSNQCHQFETQLTELIEQESVSGDDFLSLTIMLDRLISTNEQISSVFSAISRQPSVHQPVSAVETTKASVYGATDQSLYELAQSIASRQQKQVQLSTAGLDQPGFPEGLQLDVVSMASQLLRNALAHGIETPDNRKTRGKSVQGQVNLALLSDGNGSFSLICEDDGEGFNFEAITEKAIKAGLISANDKATVKPNQLLQLVVGNKLSSRDNVDDDAGRGVGLNVIHELAKRVGGKLSVKTKSNQGTRVTVRFSVNEYTNTATAQEMSYA